MQNRLVEFICRVEFIRPTAFYYDLSSSGSPNGPGRCYDWPNEFGTTRNDVVGRNLFRQADSVR
jgi:hypothetical protein